MGFLLVVIWNSIKIWNRILRN